MKSLELTGQRFWRLTVLEKVPSKNNRSMWRCVCDCGNEKVVEGRNLKKGLTKSCGCLKREEFMKNMNNPPTHKETGTRLHNEWRATITVGGKVKNLGSFLTKEEAIKARKEAEKIYWNIERD